MSLRTVRTVVGRAFALLAAGLVVVVLGITVVIPMLGGGKAYTILTGSMRPEMPPGTVVVVRPTPVNQIRTGDVVTYQIKSGDPTVVTHRVRAVMTSLSGQISFITQGDANNTPDRRPVEPVQIRGVRWYSVPYVGLPALAVNGDIRQIVVMGAVLILLGYSAVSFAGAVRDRRRKGTPVAEVGSQATDDRTTPRMAGVR
ncbi:MAG: signal peptidase [Marmoricola sp.]|nr:signal peptidase [Marmoricola sp.]